MTRDNSGQTRDFRDINLVPSRDTRDKPPLGGCPCPVKGGTDTLIDTQDGNERSA